MLKARIEIAENEQAAVERRNAERAEAAADAQVRQVEYVERKSEYELDRQLQRALAERLNKVRIDVGAIRSPVVVVERAIVPVEKH